MLGTIIRYLLDHKLTSIKEIEKVTGRGSSTIYRWMNGESQPQLMDMRLLIRNLANVEARRTILDLLTSDLPIVINWISNGQDMTVEDDQGRKHDGHEVLDNSLLAMEILSKGLHEGHDAIRRQELPPEKYAQLVKMLDDTIRHLATSRTMLKKYAPVEQLRAQGTG